LDAKYQPMAITRYSKNTSGCVVLDVKTSGIKKPKRFNKWYNEREKKKKKPSL